MGLSVSPKVILHSFSGGRLMHGTSTGFKGKFGTSWMILDVNATPCPPGTLAQVLCDYGGYQITYRLAELFLHLCHLEGPTTWTILSCGKLRLRAVLLHKGPISLGPLMEDMGRNHFFYSPHICCGVSTLDFIHHRVNSLGGNFF